MNNIAYSIGCLTLEWQNEILKNIINILKSKEEYEYSEALKILGIVAWRYEKFILKMPNKICILICEKLYISLEHKINAEKIYFIDRYNNDAKKLKSSVLVRLELLLSLLRYRNRTKDFLVPSEPLTKDYISIIDIITSKVMKLNIHLNSRIQLDIQKSEAFNKIPDLLYALRVYLTANNGAANSIKVLGVSDD